MSTNLDICIWDLDSERIENIEKKVRASLVRFKAKAKVHSNAEPPLVARMNLTAQVPVLEINGFFWSQAPGKEFTQEACDSLISLVVQQYCPKNMEKRA